MRKLEIGSGNRPLPGYEHLDIDPSCPKVDYVSSMDIVPVEDNVFDEIVSVHSIEHISWRKGIVALKEWHRVLKPNGRLYLATPNLRWLAKAYLENSSEGWYADFNTLQPAEKEHLKIGKSYMHTLWANFKIFSSTAGGDNHFACYDVTLMTAILKEVGYTKIKVLEDGPALVMEAFK